MGGQMGTYVYLLTSSYCFMMVELWNSALRNSRGGFIGGNLVTCHPFFGYDFAKPNFGKRAVLPYFGI